MVNQYDRICGIIKHNIDEITALPHMAKKPAGPRKGVMDASWVKAHPQNRRGAALKLAVNSIPPRAHRGPRPRYKDQIVAKYQAINQQKRQHQATKPVGDRNKTAARIKKLRGTVTDLKSQQGAGQAEQGAAGATESGKPTKKYQVNRTTNKTSVKHIHKTN